MMYGVEIWGCSRNLETLQHPPPKSVPATGAGRPTSGLASQAQMCCILVQGLHQPNV